MKNFVFIFDPEFIAIGEIFPIENIRMPKGYTIQTELSALSGKQRIFYTDIQK